jgi:hypothetical protein
MGDAVVLTQNAYSFFPGGEFNAVTSPDNFLPYYSPLAIVGDGFETFCIETTVDFNPGVTYSYTLGNLDSRGVALSEGAAFLYYQFAEGILPGYDYTDTGARNADAGALQSAIWWFQGGQTYGGFPTATTDAFYSYATNSLGLLNADAPNNGFYPVDVFQMWDANSQPAQNQLVVVPDNAPTLLLFGAALGALAWVAPRLRLAPAPRCATRGRLS